MRQWHVVKLGSALFDALHTYGLAICLATAGQCPITVSDTGVHYTLQCKTDITLSSAEHLLDQVLPLPDIEAMEQWSKLHRDTLPLAVLDGILAVLFTTPRAVRTASLDNICNKQQLFEKSPQRQQQTPFQQARAKALAGCKRWKDWVQQQHATHWLAEALQDYDVHSPHNPVLVQTYSKTIAKVLLTLDPSFGYSYRQPLNQGSLLNKTNLALRGVRYGALLAWIGAARFLRASYLAGEMITFMLPLTDMITIHADTFLPVARSWNRTPRHALILRLLALALQKPAQWNALAFSTLQQQGKQQAITYESGMLSIAWITHLPHRSLLVRWKQWLEDRAYDHHQDGREDLLDFLTSPQITSWYHHLSSLMTLSIQQQRFIHQQTQPLFQEGYSFEEVRWITNMLPTPTLHPLHAILQQQRGTLIFGRALRQLGRYQPASAREIREALDDVQDETTLITVLTCLVQECETAATAKPEGQARYLLVPEEQDFAAFLSDLHQHGTHALVALLKILSVLRYDRTEGITAAEVQTLIRVLLVLNRFGTTDPEGGSDQVKEEVPLSFSGDPADVFALEEEETNGEEHA